MDQQREPSSTPAGPSEQPQQAEPTEQSVPTRPAGGRHGARRSPLERARVGDPGLALLAGSVAFAVAFGVALVLGWPALLVVVAFCQVVLARSWVDFLEVPGATAATLGALVVAAVADVGVVVARLTLDAGEDADALLQLAPALGVTFLVAVLAQLTRRDGRSGALAGLVATTTGGVLVVGLAVLLPLEASAAGVGWVAFGVGVCAVVGAGLGAGAWFRRIGVPPPSLLLPLMAAVLAGPLYVLARIVAG